MERPQRSVPSSGSPRSPASANATRHPSSPDRAGQGPLDAATDPRNNAALPLARVRSEVSPVGLRSRHGEAMGALKRPGRFGGLALALGLGAAALTGPGVAGADTGLASSSGSSSESPSGPSGSSAKLSSAPARGGSPVATSASPFSPAGGSAHSAGDSPAAVGLAESDADGQDSTGDVSAAAAGLIGSGDRNGLARRSGLRDAIVGATTESGRSAVIDRRAGSRKVLASPAAPRRVGAASTAAVPAEAEGPPPARQSAPEAVASGASAGLGEPEAGHEPAAAPESAPVSSETPDVVGDASGPLTDDNPFAPVDSPAAWVLLAAARREISPGAASVGLQTSALPTAAQVVSEHRTSSPQSAAPGLFDNPITVNSVDIVLGVGVIDGFIDADSSRGLPLAYTVGSEPNRGGKISLGPAGEFTLMPDPSVVAAGGTEQFSVLISEKTRLEALLQQVPLLDAFVPQIFVNLRRVPIVRDLLAPFIGYAVVKQIEVYVGDLTLPDEPSPVPLPVEAGAGWNVYSWQASSDSVVAAIERQQPGLVRWIVEMDRFLEDETQPFWPSRSWSWDADTSFDPFFEALADNDTTLVISLWNKDHWAKSMRACSTCGWPQIDEFAAFVQDLDAEADKFGVSVIFEAQNEPDLRWGSLNAATNIGATENFTSQWYTGLPQGYAQYRGGTGDLWQQMHEVVDAPFASGGIVSRYNAEINWIQRLTGNYSKMTPSTRWIDATAPLVEFTSFHRYGLANTTVDEYVDWVYDEWSIWKGRKGYAVPFYIGEIGPSSTGTQGFTNAEAAMMRGIHTALATDSRFEGAYLGMTSHVVSRTDAPNPWETSTGWWNPAFDVSDVI